MTQVSYALTLFFSLVLETTPFLLLGVFVSSALLVFVNQYQWQHRFPKNPLLGSFLGSGLGFLFPVGQYGTFPIARRLLLQGISLPIAISFILAAPTINPIVLWVSWRIFAQQGHLELFYVRVILTVMISVIVSLIFAAYAPTPKPAIEEGAENALVVSQPQPKLHEASELLNSGSALLFPLPYQPLKEFGTIIYDYHKTDGSDLAKSEQWRLFRDNFSGELLEWGSLLIIGCAIATIVQSFLPQGQILATATTPTTQIINLSALGVILSLDTWKDSALATTLITTFSSSSIIAFLLFNSMLNLKALPLIFGSLRLKFSLYLVIITSQLIFALILLLDFFGQSLLK
jgi:uncharacterized protein